MNNFHPSSAQLSAALDELQRLAREESGRNLTQQQLNAAAQHLREGIPAENLAETFLHIPGGFDA